MRRSLFVHLLLVLLAAPRAHAQPFDPCMHPEPGALRPYLPRPTWTSTYLGAAPDVRRYEDFYDDSPQTDEPSSWRWLLGGGVVLPLSTPVSFYDIGGGATVGLEFPQSDVHSYLIRLEYDHMNEGGPFLHDLHGRADVGTLRGAVRIARRRHGALSEFTEAGLGVAIAGFSSREPRYETNPAGELVLGQAVESTVDFAPLFAIGGGLELNPSNGGPGAFIETHILFLMGRTNAELAPIRVGVVVPWSR